MLALLAGCDDDGLVASALLEVVPAELDFGPVATGESRTQILSLRNGSTSAALRLEQVGLQEGSAPAFSLGEAPAEIAPGGEAALVVRYTADDGEPDAAQVEILSSAAANPRLLVPLRSARTFPRLVVQPPLVDLGSVAEGGSAERRLVVENRGLAALVVSRASLRTEGFAGEACASDGDCREGRCTGSLSGRICARPCEDDQGCDPAHHCTLGQDGLRACRERTATPVRRARGFTLSAGDAPGLAPLLGGRRVELALSYAPTAAERGNATLLLESNDPERPLLAVPLLGLPDNLPPIAAAALAPGAPAALIPGSVVPLTGLGSRDPEGSVLGYAWRFVRRPEGSRAAFEAAEAMDTRFVVDLPGSYAARLEVRDASGLVSTNDARVEVEAGPGQNLRLALTWDRAEADLDLHLVAPGAPLGSLLDCFQENPAPDWPPAGPGGDPVLTSSAAGERITLAAPAPGVYTLVVTVPAASPRGAAEATLSLQLEGVEATRWAAALPPAARQWDVATLSWPSGQVVTLGTVR